MISPSPRKILDTLLAKASAGSVLGFPTATHDDMGQALLLAVQEQAPLEVVRHLLIMGAPADFTLPKLGLNTPPLSFACEQGQLDMVKLLVRFNAPLEPPAHQIQPSALMLAAGSGNVELVNYLLDQGADIHAHDASYAQALSYAVARGHAEVCSVLVSRGASIEQVFYQTDSPLHRACSMEEPSEKIIEILLRAGADPDSFSKDGVSAHDLLEKHAGFDLIDTLLAKIAADNLSEVVPEVASTRPRPRM